MSPVSGIHASKIQTINHAILNTPHTDPPPPPWKQSEAFTACPSALEGVAPRLSELHEDLLQEWRQHVGGCGNEHLRLLFTGQRLLLLSPALL